METQRHEHVYNLRWRLRQMGSIPFNNRNAGQKGCSRSRGRLLVLSGFQVDHDNTVGRVASESRKSAFSVRMISLALPSAECYSEVDAVIFDCRKCLSLRLDAKDLARSIDSYFGLPANKQRGHSAQPAAWNTEQSAGAYVCALHYRSALCSFAQSGTAYDPAKAIRDCAVAAPKVVRVAVSPPTEYKQWFDSGADVCTSYEELCLDPSALLPYLKWRPKR